MDSRKTTWLLRHRTLLLLGFGALTVALLSQLPNLVYDFSPQQLFETADKDEVWEFSERTIERFGRHDSTLLVLLDTGPGGDVLQRAKVDWLKRLCEELGSRRDVERVLSVATATTVTETPEGDIEVDVAGKLSPEEIIADPLLVGSLVSADRRMAVAHVDFQDDRRTVAQLAESIGAVRDWISTHPPPGNAEVSLGGIPYIRLNAVESIQSEQLVFVPIVGVLLLLALVAAFRRWSRAVFPLLTGLLAIIWTLAVMAIFDIHVDILNGMLPILLIVIGVSDSVHLIVRDHEEHRAGLARTEALSVAVSALVVSCFLTSFTTAVGFASLRANSTIILAQFGTVVAVGVMFAYVVTMGVLPQLLSLAPGPSARAVHSTKLAQVAIKMGTPALRWPKTVVVVGVLAALGCLYVGVHYVHVDVKLTELYGADHPVQVTQTKLDDHLGGVAPIGIVVTLPEEGGHKDPEILRRLAGLQDYVDQQPDVTSTRSVVDFIEALHRSLAGADAGRLPDTRELAAQEWLVSEMGGEQLPLERFASDQGRYLRMLVRTKDVGSQRILKVVERIERRANQTFADMPDVHVGLAGDAYLASRNTAALIRDLFASLAQASVVIFLTLLFVFRSARYALVAIIPNAFPLVATLGIMAAVGLDLDITNVVIFAVALGLAVDDTIHVIARFREENRSGAPIEEVLVRTLGGSGQAVLLTSVALGGGLLVLLLSEFVATSRFAWLLSFTVAMALVADLVILPALLLLAHRKSAGQS